MPHPILDEIFAAALALMGGHAAGFIVGYFWDAPNRRQQIALMLATAGMVLWSYCAVSPQLLLLTCCLGWALLVLASIDLFAYRLPDAITFPLVALGLAITMQLPEPSLGDRMIGAAVGYGVFAGLACLYRALRGRDGLGLGDAKLAAAAGAWLGWALLPVFILLACIGGFAWIVLRLIRSPQSLHHPLPFGVPLAGAFWILWLYAPYFAPLP